MSELNRHSPLAIKLTAPPVVVHRKLITGDNEKLWLEYPLILRIIAGFITEPLLYFHFLHLYGCVPLKILSLRIIFVFFSPSMIHS